MILFRYISLSILLLFGGVGYSQDNLIVPAPLDRFVLSYDGVDEYSNLDNTLTVLSSTTVGTWSGWIRPSDATPSPTDFLISAADTDADVDRFQIAIQSDGKLQAFVRSASTNQWLLLTDAVAFSDNTFAHWAVVVNGASSVIYINSVAIPQGYSITTDKTKYFNDFTNVDNLNIGALNNGGTGLSNFFSGLIDEISFWNIALTQPQIAEIYNNNKPTNLKTHSQYANLVGWYQQGEFSTYDGTNWNIVDASVNDNTAVTVNMEESDRVISTLIYEQPIGMLRVGRNLITSP